MKGVTVDYRQNSDLTIGISLICLESLRPRMQSENQGVKRAE